MKLNLLFSSVAIATVSLFSNCCNNENTVTDGNPTGLYRLEKVGYENGNADRTPSMEQYKYCGTNLALTLAVRSIHGGDVSIYMNNKEAKPLTFTGNVADSKEIQIFDSNDNQFTERWYNAATEGTKTFPAESYILEKYTKNYMSYGVVNAIEMLKLNIDTKYNKFMGIWRCKNEETKRIIYKIYSPEYVMLISSVNGETGKESLGLRVAEVDYMPEIDGKILEGFGHGNECDIEWSDDNTFYLTWMSYGKPETEVWKRCGLPQNFQDLFGTNVPVLE